jgi:hypothetical protein
MNLMDNKFELMDSAHNAPSIFDLHAVLVPGA